MVIGRRQSKSQITLVKDEHWATISGAKAARVAKKNGEMRKCDR